TRFHDLAGGLDNVVNSSGANLGLLWWQGDDKEPEGFNGTHDVQELVEIDRFSDVTVGVEAIGAQNILVGARGGEDDDGDGFQGVVGFDFSQDLATIFAREIQVEHDQIRSRRQSVFTAMPEELKGLFAVFNNAKVVTHLGFFECFDR